MGRRRRLRCGCVRNLGSGQGLYQGGVTCGGDGLCVSTIQTTRCQLGSDRTRSKRYCSNQAHPSRRLTSCQDFIQDGSTNTTADGIFYGRNNDSQRKCFVCGHVYIVNVLAHGSLWSPGTRSRGLACFVVAGRVIGGEEWLSQHLGVGFDFASMRLWLDPLKRNHG